MDAAVPAAAFCISQNQSSIRRIRDTYSQKLEEYCVTDIPEYYQQIYAYLEGKQPAGAFQSSYVYRQTAAPL